MEAATPPPPPPAPPPPSAPPPGIPDYPVNFDIEYPEQLSHWKVLVKWLFAIPQFIIVYLLQTVNGVIIFIGFFCVLFTKKWPRGMFDFSLMIQRWTFNTYAYALTLMRDEYPPFSGEPGQYPLMLEVEYREDLSRWMIFVKWLLAIPHYFVLLFVVFPIAFFVILFTGRYPRGLFDFVVGVARWAVRVNAYAFWFMTDRYPPFSLR
jgi:hypothetical protein